jgi:hypothetical protein
MRLARRADTPTCPSADPCSPDAPWGPGPGDKSPLLSGVPPGRVLADAQEVRQALMGDSEQRPKI